MKRILILILAVSLTLTGCGAAAMATPQAPATAVTEETPPATEASKEIIPDLPQVVPEVTEEALPPAELEPAEILPPPEEPQTPPEENTLQPPVQPLTPPTTADREDIPSVPQSTPPVTPAAPAGRPTSSATCKDTGSDRIWEDPDGDKPDYYQETDPSREAYLRYLQEEGNMYYFWIQEEVMQMYLGRQYGIPLFTSYEMLLACTWVSSDPTVATVNEVGFVVPMKEGKTVVTVTHTDPQTMEATTRQCEITVTQEPGPFTFAQLEQRAKEEAQLIANFAMNYPGATTDLQRIAVAAALVNQYVAAGNSGSRYGIVDGELVEVYIPGYNQPFGTLVTFYSTCAGSTRAMGLVLEYMGFSWYHVNENQWDHQWCVVYDVDGQTAFADGSVLGVAGYGQRQENQSNWIRYQNGAFLPCC